MSYDANGLSSFTQFDDLNVDCKLLILEEFDIFGLLSIAETKANVHILANDIFRRKFPQKTLYIFKPYSMGLINITNDSIEINDFQLAVKFVNIFGSFITNLAIHEREPSTNINEIIAVANGRCTKLNTLSVSAIVNHVPFDGVQKPFSQATDVSINCEKCQLSTEQLKFNEMFPKARSLSLNIGSLIGRGFDDAQFSHLEHLGLTYIFINDSLGQNVSKLIELNPQIRSLAISDGSVEFLKIAGEMPHLDTLSIDLIAWNNQSDVKELNFKQCRHLVMNSYDMQFLPICTFAGLKEVTIRSSHLSDLWLEFMSAHASLNKLNILKGIVNELHLIHIGHNIPNLVEISFPMNPQLSAQSIVDFLHENTNLEKIELFFDEMTTSIDTTLNDLQNQNHIEWRIVRNQASFIIERI